MSFNKKYFFWALLLFLLEVGIAIRLHDNFFRAFVGDVLVVLLIYCSIQSFLKCSPLKLALFVLAICFSIETLQYLQIIDLLGLSSNKLAICVLGTSFSWADFLCYLLGFSLILLFEDYGSRLFR